MPWLLPSSKPPAKPDPMTSGLSEAGTIWLVGCGNMGGAMLRGWLAQGLAPGQLTVIDPASPQLPAGVRLLDAIPAGAEQPDVLVLAVKPQLLRNVTTVMQAKPGAPGILISILAGVESDVLREGFSAAATVRVMPNLPAQIGQGVSALYSFDADNAQRALAEALLAVLGTVEWIDDEAMFHAVTALSGSGPGFVFRFIDALAEAGIALGLPPELAARLAAATVAGSANLARESDETPAVLADRVASPGGTTREGLNRLDEADGIKRLLHETLAAAARRSTELAAAARGKG